jgi:uncharacterized membrane protein
MLDAATGLAGPFADKLVSSPRRRDLLQGRWLGHAVHPMLTDLPIGFWTSATVLDVLGGKPSRPASTLLVALGIVSAVPTAATGLAEFAPLEQREKRVAVVHAASNTVALSFFTASLSARLRGQHWKGVALGMVGGLAATAGGYLGGHLTSARKVSSRSPAFERPTIV